MTLLRENFTEPQHPNTITSHDPTAPVSVSSEWEMPAISGILGMVIREVELRIPRVSTSMSLPKTSEG
ncbi:hypothetical protein ABZ791_26715 [Streptomyces huasconensis]|uniref:Uncharacterized protein n=1 Tax=Streptomyces huasconensis TaxID=1854574 RepID=A0ABV3LWH7_9ACTN